MKPIRLDPTDLATIRGGNRERTLADERAKTELDACIRRDVYDKAPRPRWSGEGRALTPEQQRAYDDCVEAYRQKTRRR